MADAQLKVKLADAAFARSTYERWRDSPKGVVSEQEREDKKAGDAAAEAQTTSARAQVDLDHIPAELEDYESAMLWKSLRALCSRPLFVTEVDGARVRVLAPTIRDPGLG